MINGTVSEWATSLGIEGRTLLTQLTKSGVNVTPRMKLTAKTVFDARLGDMNAEKLRLTSAQAMAVEIENAEKAEVLNRRTEVERIVWEETLSPLRDLLIGYPNTVGVKMKSALQSHGISQEISQEVRDIACNGVADIIALIRRPVSVVPKRK